MKPNCIDPKTGRNAKISEEKPCKFGVGNLLDFLTSGYWMPVTLIGQGEVFYLQLSGLATVRREDGSIDAYGSSGSDENSVRWCVCIPPDIKDSRGGYIDTVAYKFLHNGQLLLPINL